MLSYVGAIASAGKSLVALLEASAHVQRGGWVIYIAPTVDLIRQAAEVFRGFGSGVEPEIIHSGTASIVGVAILDTLKRRPADGRLLLITWSAFESLPFFPGRGSWRLIVDEIPQAAVVHEVVAPETHIHITNDVELLPQGPVWSRVLAKRPGRLRRLVTSHDHALKAGLGAIAGVVLSSFWATYTRTEAFQSLIRGKTKKLTVHSVLRPRIFAGFDRVTILGANFKNSLLFKLWHFQGVVFEEDEGIERGLRCTEHCGDGVTICYAVDEPWSKSLRDWQDGALWNRIVTAVTARVSGAPFGWLANKDVGPDLFTCSMAVELPQVSHGLNAYQHLDQIVFLSARLPSPDHFSFLEWMGVTSDDVRQASYLEPVYQTSLRGSTRDINNRNAKTLVVPDRAAAEFLQRLLPGSTLEKLDVDTSGLPARKRRGRHKKHEDGTGRVQHHRAKQQAELRRLSALMMADPFTMTGEQVLQYRAGLRNVCNGNPIRGDALDSVSVNRPGTNPRKVDPPSVNSRGVDSPEPNKGEVNPPEPNKGEMNPPKSNEGEVNPLGIDRGEVNRPGDDSRAVDLPWVKGRVSPPGSGTTIGSIFTHRYATHPSIIVNEATELFIKSLKQVHKENVVDEEEQPLFCPAVFDPDLPPETDLGVDHVLYASGVWLDVEDGHLTHRDLAMMFPFVRIVAFNSFRSTKPRPRFTVYIPTSRLLTAKEYRVITGQVLQTVKNAGFRLRTRMNDHPKMKAHGIDLGKMHAASLFCVPCQPRDPTGRIWKDYKGADRHPLDVDDWLYNAIAVEVDEPEATPAAPDERA